MSSRLFAVYGWLLTLTILAAAATVAFSDPGIDTYPAAQCGSDTECMQLCPVDDLDCDGGPELEP